MNTGKLKKLINMVNLQIKFVDQKLRPLQKTKQHDYSPNLTEGSNGRRAKADFRYYLNRVESRAAQAAKRVYCRGTCQGNDSQWQ